MTRAQRSVLRRLHRLWLGLNRALGWRPMRSAQLLYRLVSIRVTRWMPWTWQRHGARRA